MLPPFEMDEAPPSGRLGAIYKMYRPLVDFLDQEGAMGLCIILATHTISTGLVMFLGGFILTAPFWALNFVPRHAYPSVAIQLGTVAAYFLVLVVPIPVWRALRKRFPGCLAAIVTVISWEVLVIRWFCVEDDRTSHLSRFFLVPIVRNLVFILATVMIIYAGTLAWSSSRASGSWPPRLWIAAVLAELFVVQEFYRNGV